MVSTGFGLGISHQHSHPVSNSAPQGSLAIRKNSILQWCTGGQVEITIYIQNSPTLLIAAIIISLWQYWYPPVCIHTRWHHKLPALDDPVASSKEALAQDSQPRCHMESCDASMMKHCINIAYQFFQAKTDHEYSWCSKASSFAASERNENSS